VEILKNQCCRTFLQTVVVFWWKRFGEGPLFSSPLEIESRHNGLFPAAGGGAASHKFGHEMTHRTSTSYYGRRNPR